jgi:hypothetical protein
MVDWISVNRMMGFKSGSRDPEERLHRRRAIDGGGLVDVARDALHAGQVDHHVPADPLSELNMMMIAGLTYSPAPPSQ